jgi:hypothetical protein
MHFNSHQKQKNNQQNRSHNGHLLLSCLIGASISTVHKFAAALRCIVNNGCCDHGEVKCSVVYRRFLNPSYTLLR